MSFKLSLKTSQAPPTGNAASPVQTPAISRPKIKLSASQPPTPAVEQAPSYAPVSAQTKKSRKRTGDELASPAVKRVASDAKRKASVVLKLPQRADGAGTAQSAGPRIKLAKRQSFGPKLKRLSVKGRVPDRVLGNAYDSEDSERELDPAKEQHLVLRMLPGEDCDLVRKAITERNIGSVAQEGGLDVTFKFLDRELRRVLVTVRGHMYAAIVVDLPCIVETMKSWDKRGWWKVADISQMLLVLGRVNAEEQARNYALPERVLNDKSWAYAHGLTPPMHWVRKRRFRKRLSYKDTANAEEEVNKLLQEDQDVERHGGTVSFEIHSRDVLERSAEPDMDYDQDGDAMESIEQLDDDGYGDEYEEDEEEMDLDDTEALIQAGFDEAAASPATGHIASRFITDSPLVLEPAGVGTKFDSPSETPTGAQTPAETGDELFGEDNDQDDESSDDDVDDDDDDAFDEDAQARRTEQSIQQQEIQDLETEIALQRQKLAATKNQLLLQRQKDKLKSLEEDLQMKRRVYGLTDQDED